VQTYTPHPLVQQALEHLACEIRKTDALHSPEAVKDFLRLKLGDRPHEVFLILLLDSQNRIISFEEMFRGTLTQTSVYSSEIVLEALKQTAAAIILCHNHPSGSCTPPRAEEVLTQNLKAALALVDVRVLDHMIVTRGGCLSFAERGLL
jgi:DNA repair protein RadC